MLKWANEKGFSIRDGARRYEGETYEHGDSFLSFQDIEANVCFGIPIRLETLRELAQALSTIVEKHKQAERV